MKHRDPSIKVGTAGHVFKVRKPDAVPTASLAGRVFRVATPAQMPEKATVSGSGRSGQGGLPPVPNRTPWSRASDTGRGAREPFNSKQVKGEYWSTKKELA